MEIQYVLYVINFILSVLMKKLHIKKCDGQTKAVSSEAVQSVQSVQLVQSIQSVMSHLSAYLVTQGFGWINKVCVLVKHSILSML